MLNKFFLLFSFCCICFLPLKIEAQGQNEEDETYYQEEKTELLPAVQSQRGLNENEWNTLTKQSDYFYKDADEMVVQEKTQNNFNWVKLLNKFFKSDLVKWIAYILIGGIVFIILRKIWQNFHDFSRKKAAHAAMETEGNPDKLDEVDWEQLMTNAHQNGQWRQAVRYSYLLVLQKLWAAELIGYTAEKTNADYLRELKNVSLKPNFRRLVRFYEYTWYGQYPIDEQLFLTHLQSIKSFNQKLKIYG